MASAALFFVGLVVGSFLNVCIDRIPREESLVFPPSHCDICGHALSWLDLVPVLSYLGLSGKCRYCGEPLSWRLPVVELATGALFAGLALQLGFNPRLAAAIVYVSIFLIIFVVDMERQVIPNRLLYPALPVAGLLSLLWPPSEAARDALGFLIAVFQGGDTVLAISQSLAGGLAAFLVLLVPWLVFPSGIGSGDVKLAALVGLTTGFPLCLLAMLLSVVSGGLVAVVLLLSGSKGRKEPIPFGPFL
ncbi:MAG: prepilin peptidase, partial [Dehalococcoidia bacterium]|nr:prepilin peptidase [Dehalococcoidia bacterium]